MTSLPSNAGVEEVRLQTADELPNGLAALLEEIHDGARRALQSLLREMAKTTITVTRSDATQASYSAITRGMEIPSSVAAVRSDALGGPFIAHLDASLSSAFIDLRLGGRIRPALDRWPTAVDTAVVSMIVERLLSPVQDAFRPVLDLDCTIVNFETSPSFVFDVAPDDPVVAYQFDCTLDDEPLGSFTLIYPFSSLQKLVERVPSSTAAGMPNADPNTMALDDVEVELRAMVGPTAVRVGDFLSLQPGDVLVLDQWADEPGIGMVHGIPLLELTVGATSGHVAALVERWKD